MTLRPLRPVPGSRAASLRRADPVSRLRSSLLLKIMAALVVAVVGSSTITAFFETRLARSALRDQALRVTTTNLRLLEQALAAQERGLKAALRSLGQSLVAEGRLQPERHNDLIGELGTVSRNLELEVLQVVQADGRAFDPPAMVGQALSAPPIVSALDRRAPASRLITIADGRWVQAVVMPIGSGAGASMIVGAYEFGDALAYSLRRVLRDSGHVVLVADGRVVGTTLTDPPARPPARAEGGGKLPTAPVVIDVRGEDTLAAYRPVVRSTTGAQGAVGVLLADPEAPLERSLANTRALAAGVLATLALTLGWLFFRRLVRPLVGLKTTAGRIASGDLEASFTASGRDEIADLAHSLERMRLELRAHLDLIAAQAAELQDSSQRIVAAQDEERHRLARDLHDGIQQQLVVLRMGFGLVKETAERNPRPLAASLEELGAGLDAVIETLREVSHDLYPSILVDRGLAAALRTCIGRLPLSARLDCTPDPLPRLPAEIESGAYFLVGEALANALKHANASALVVRLEVQNGWLDVLIRDNGRGFAADGHEHSGGLLHMADRARSFGGDLRILSRPGSGTEIRATFPVRAAADVGTVG